MQAIAADAVKRASYTVHTSAPVSAITVGTGPDPKVRVDYELNGSAVSGEFDKVVITTDLDQAGAMLKMLSPDLQEE